RNWSATKNSFSMERSGLHYISPPTKSLSFTPEGRDCILLHEHFGLRRIVRNAWLEKTLNEFTQEIRRLLSDELVAVVLYGSGAGANFVPDHSDINIVIVVKSVQFNILQKLQPHLAVWRKRGFAMPLLLDQEFLQRARDVFPMEFHDICEQYRLL